MSNTPKIKLTDVKKSFGQKVVLDGVSLEVNAGEALVIIGGAGTGKSVTLKSILGLITPDSGEVYVDGDDVLSMNANERQTMMKKFGMLFQGAALFDSMKVWENVAFGTRQKTKLQASGNIWEQRLNNAVILRKIIACAASN